VGEEPQKTGGVSGADEITTPGSNLPKRGKGEEYPAKQQNMRQLAVLTPERQKKGNSRSGKDSGGQPGKDG